MILTLEEGKRIKIKLQIGCPASYHKLTFSLVYFSNYFGFILLSVTLGNLPR